MAPKKAKTTAGVTAPALPMPLAAPPAGMQLRQPEPPAFFFAEGGVEGADID